MAGRRALRGPAAGPRVGLGALGAFPEEVRGLEGTPLPPLTMNGGHRGTPRPGEATDPRRAPGGKGCARAGEGGPTSVPTHLSPFFPSAAATYPRSVPEPPLSPLSLQDLPFLSLFQAQSVAWLQLEDSLSIT